MRSKRALLVTSLLTTATTIAVFSACLILFFRHLVRRISPFNWHSVPCVVVMFATVVPTLAAVVRLR